MDLPESLQFTKEHEWITETTGVIKVGISHFALEQLGDIVHVELPEVGTEFQTGDAFGTIESTKTVSDIYSPGGGKVLEINEQLLDSPEEITNDPYQNGWLVKLELTTPIKEGLLNSKEYASYIQESH